MKEQFTFDVEIEWQEKMKGILKTKSGHKMVVDAPTEFGGTGEGFCPDELFAASLGGCVMTTFFFLAEKMKISIQKLNINCRVKIRFVRGRYRVYKATINLNVKVKDQNQTKVVSIFNLIKDYCNISGSLDNCIEIEYHFEFLG